MFNNIIVWEQIFLYLDAIFIYQKFIFGIVINFFFAFNSRPTISGPVSSPKEEIGRPYEEIEFEDKKVNGTTSPQLRANGEIIGTKVPAGLFFCLYY